MNKLHIKKNTIFAWFLSFGISLFLVMATIIVICQYVLFSDASLIKSLERTKYYDSVVQEINNNLQYTSGAAGIEPVVFEDFIKVEVVQKEINNKVLDKGDGKATIDTFTTQIKNHLKTKGYSEEQINSESMKLYIEIQAKEYVKHINFPLVKYYTMAKEMLQLTFPYIVGISVAMLVITLVLLKLGLTKEEFIKWVGSSLCASGLMIGVIPITLFIFQTIQKVNLVPEYYYRFFVEYIHNFLYIMLLVAMTQFVCGVLLKVLRYKMEKKQEMIKTEDAISII